MSSLVACMLPGPVSIYAEPGLGNQNTYCTGEIFMLSEAVFV
jgi:hypothetical protein